MINLWKNTIFYSLNQKKFGKNLLQEVVIKRRNNNKIVQTLETYPSKMYLQIINKIIPNPQVAKAIEGLLLIILTRLIKGYKLTNKNH